MTSQIDRTERALLTAVVAHPWLLEEHGEVFAALAFPQAVLDSLKSRFLEEASRHPGLDGEAFAAHLRQPGLGPQLDPVTGEPGRVRAEERRVGNECVSTCRYR